MSWGRRCSPKKTQLWWTQTCVSLSQGIIFYDESFLLDGFIMIFSPSTQGDPDTILSFCAFLEWSQTRDCEGAKVKRGTQKWRVEAKGTWVTMSAETQVWRHPRNVSFIWGQRIRTRRLPGKNRAQAFDPKTISFPCKSVGQELEHTSKKDHWISLSFLSASRRQILV